MQRMAGGHRMSLDLSDRSQGIAYLIRRYDAELVNYIVRNLPRGGVFLDVGAHVGLITFAVADSDPTRASSPSSRIRPTLSAGGRTASSTTRPQS